MRFWALRSKNSSFFSGALAVVSTLFLASGCNPIADTQIATNWAPGVQISPTDSQLEVENTQVVSGGQTSVTLFLRDKNDVPYVSTLPIVAFSTQGRTGIGSLSSVINNGDGSYSSVFTATGAGVVTIQATVDGQELLSALPTITVIGGTPTTIAVNSGNNQNAVAGSALGSPLVALVTDSSNNPVSGISITWAATGGGGSVAACSSSTTNASGLASCTPTLGTTAGTNTFTASVSGVATPATFIATGVASSSIASLVWQTAPSTTYTASNSTHMTAFSVVLKDSGGNTITSNSSTTVTVSITSGSGTLGGTTTVTAVNGIATFSAVTDTTASTITIQARENTSNNTVTQAGVVVSPLSTIASLVWGTAPSTTYTASSSTAMTTFTAKLEDTYGNVITTNSTTTVTASITSGSGTLGGTTTVTAASGVATFNAVTDTTASTITIQAKENTSNNTVTQASVQVSPGAFSLSNSQVSSASSVTSGSSITVTLTAKDAYGNVNPSGITAVAFTSSTVGGTGTFGSVTNAGSGVYTVSFTAVMAGSCVLGATINTSAVTSTSSPASITISAGTPVVISANSGANQSGTVSTALNPFGALVTDTAGNPVQNITVTWAITSGGGTLSVASSTTSSSGLAYSTLTLGSTGGTTNVSATIQSTSYSTSFSAVAHASPPAPPAFSVTATPSNGSVTVSWSALGATSYTLKYGTTPGTYGTTVSTSAASPTTIMGLTNGTVYYFAVVAINSGGSTTEVASASPSNLTLTPVVSTVQTNASVQLIPIGGTAPYTYSKTSGNGSVSSSGVFTAPSSSDTDVITVTDATTATASATIKVTSSTTIVNRGLVFNVDASIPNGSSFPGDGCTSSSWEELVNGATGTINYQSSCSTARSWVGSGTASSPYALAFDGTNSVTFANNPNMKVTLPMTAEVWISPTTGQNSYFDVISDSEAPSVTPQQFSFDLITSSGRTLFTPGYSSGGTLYQASSNLPLYPGQWQQFIITDDGTNWSFCRGGGYCWPQVSNTHPTVDISNGAIQISGTNGFTHTFVGQIAAIHLYNIVLSANQMERNCVVAATRSSSIYCYQAPYTPTKLVISGPSTNQAGQCVAYTITTENSSNNVAETLSQLQVSLSATGGTFYSDSGCQNSITSTTIAADSSSVTIYYMPPSNQNVTITASGGSLTNGAQSVSVPAPGAFALTASPEDSKVLLSWSSSNAVSYTLAYGTSPGSYTTTVSTNASSPTTINGLTDGTPYYFQVTAVNTTGSTTASATAVPQALTLTPQISSMTKNGSLLFTAKGGTPPYTYSSTMFGSINSSTGIYTAPNSTGTATITVEDHNSSSATATVTVTSSASIVNRGLVFDVDATLANGSSFPGDGCTSTSWEELINGVTGTINYQTSCSTARAWVGSGTASSPYALAFDGTNNVTFGNNPNMKVTIPMSAEFWIAPTTGYLSYYDVISDSEAPSVTPQQFSFDLIWDGWNTYAAPGYSYNGGTLSQVLGTNNYSMAHGGWEHLVVTDDGTNWNVCVHASCVTIANSHPSVDLSNGIVQISGTNGFTHAYVGDIAAIRLYNQVLTPNQIAKGCALMSSKITPQNSCTVAVNTPTKLAISGSTTPTSGQCVPYTVITESNSGAVAEAVNAVVIDLSATGSGTFYSDSACSNSITGTRIETDTSSSIVYFKPSANGGMTLFVDDVTETLTEGSLSVN